MKMKYTALLVAFLMIPQVGQSQPRSEPLTDDEKGGVAIIIEEMTHKVHPKMDCEGLTLDDAQKMALKEAYFEFRKEMNLKKAIAKNAMMDYAHTLKDMNSTKADGTTAMNGVKDAMSDLGMLRGNFELTVFYDILTPEQREPAWKCAMKKMKEHAQKKLERACSKLPPKEGNRQE